MGRILAASLVLLHHNGHPTASSLLLNCGSWYVTGLYHGCSSASPAFWFLGVPQYASFWQVLVALDLTVLVMLPEAS